jgi:predicted AlkP superfamily pyrophosphatase or phosphodiesterase
MSHRPLGIPRSIRRHPALRIALLVLGAACAPASRIGSVSTTLAGGRAALPDARTSHVVVISVDGLRPDAIGRYGAPTIRRLAREGRATLNARTIVPSLTLPSHTSMLTGVGPDQHGIKWNDDQVVGRGLVGVPTVFAVAHAAGLRTAAFFSKAKFRHLMLPNSLDYAQAPTGWWGRWTAGRTTDDVRDYLRGSARPNLLFVHLGEADYAGHTLGWMSWGYGRAVGRADAAVAQVVASADAAFGPGRYTLLLTADHGGHGRTHGTADSVDVTIPRIAWGQAVATADSAPLLAVRTMDTAATALWLLGVPIPKGWDGRPVTAAFRTDTAR